MNFWSPLNLVMMVQLAKENSPQPPAGFRDTTEAIVFQAEDGGGKSTNPLPHKPHLASGVTRTTGPLGFWEAPTVKDAKPSEKAQRPEDPALVCLSVRVLCECVSLCVCAECEDVCVWVSVWVRRCVGVSVGICL